MIYKKVRVDFAKQMLSILRMHLETNFHYILTGDWFLFHYEPVTQWVISPEELYEKLNPKKYEKKVMVAIFLVVMVSN